MRKIFSDYDAYGCIYLENRDGFSLVYNQERASIPLIPASTFKIPNTLIALADGVTDLEETFIWDGQQHQFEGHNQNHTLLTAYKHSCVWVYQELAERIGRESYQVHLEKMSYGNQKLGPDIKRFWLDGDLRIIPIQQVEFLKRIYSEDLPYDSDLLAILKEIMLEQKTSTYQLHTKTGYAIRSDGQHGWYVGWIDAVEDLWFFAMNIEMKGVEDLSKRKEITMSIFRKMGLV